MKTAPVQGQKDFRVPWDIHVRAWQVYAALGHGDQSAQRLAERGGFGALELALLLGERNPWAATGTNEDGDFKPLTEYQRSRLRALRERNAEAE